MVEQVNHVIEGDARNYIDQRMDRLRHVLNRHRIPGAERFDIERPTNELITFGENASLEIGVRYPGVSKGAKTMSSRIAGRSLIDHWVTVSGSYGLPTDLRYDIADLVFGKGLAVHMRASDVGEWADLAITDAGTGFPSRRTGELGQNEYLRAQKAVAGRSDGHDLEILECNETFAQASEQLGTDPELLAGLILDVPEHMLLMARGVHLNMTGTASVTTSARKI